MTMSSPQPYDLPPGETLDLTGHPYDPTDRHDVEDAWYLARLEQDYATMYRLGRILREWPMPER